MSYRAVFHKSWFDAINNLEGEEYRDTLLAIAEVAFNCEVGEFCFGDKEKAIELRNRAIKLIDECKRGIK